MSLYDDALSIYTFDNTWDDAKGNYDITNDGATFDSVNQIVGTACASLDGFDDAPQITALLTALSSTTQGGIALWIRPGDVTSAGVFVGFGDTDANAYLIFQTLVPGSVRADLRRVSGVQWSLEFDTATISNDTWAHIVLNHNGTEPSMWLNGVEEDQTFTTDVDRARWFNDISGVDTGRLGALNYNSLGNQFFYDGKLDEAVFLSDRPFTASEIAFMYNGGAGRQIGSRRSQLLLLTGR